MNRQFPKLLVRLLQSIYRGRSFDVFNRETFLRQRLSKVPSARNEKEQSFGVPLATGAHPRAFNEHNRVALGVSSAKDSITSMEMIEWHVQNPLHLERIVSQEGIRIS